MNNLKEIVSRLKKARALTQVNLEDVDPRFRSGVEGSVRGAQRDIEELEALYKDNVVQSLYIVGVTGAGSNRFAKLAEDKVLCVDGGLATNILTGKVSARSNHDSFGGQELSMLMGELLELKTAYGITSLPPIQDRGLANEVAHLSLRAAIDKVLKNNYGSQLHSIAVRKHIGTLALESLHDGPNLVAVIYNYEGVDTDFLPTPVAVLEAKEDLSQEDVTEMLDKIRQSVSKVAYKAKTKSGKSASKEAQNEQQ